MPLSLDTSGLATANRVEGEQITLTPSILATFGCIYLAQGPFFGKNFAISYTAAAPGSTAVPLQLGIDYDFKFELPGFGSTPQDKVWGAINLYNQGLNGTLSVSYQSLGGNWIIDQQAIKNYLNSNQFNSNVQYIALVARDPLHLPNNPSAEWPLNSIQSVMIAQAQIPAPGITLSVAFLLIEGDDDGIEDVIVLETPLPPNAAQETGGNLATIAGAMGTPANAVNQQTGGTGMLGWLSGLFSLMTTAGTNIASILARLNQIFTVSQSGVWSVGLTAGTNAVGTVYSTAFAEIVDYTTTPGFVYICEAAPGSTAAAGVWRIQKIDLSTGSVTWAGGTGNFDKIANNRGSLSYS
jgi:hypothetical protein